MTFGDLLDPDSKVFKLSKSPRKYKLLEELNADPSVIYLKRVMKDGSSATHEE
jgi:molybdopterin-containing oxidoreductase family iron-sulfur binding subunit